MARRKSTEAPILKSWAEVNEALRQMALAEIAISDIESVMEKQMLGIKKVAEIDCQPYIDRIKSIVNDIEIFAKEHRDDLGKLKTMQLTFGEVGYRITTSVSVPNAKDKVQDIIRRLRNFGMDECIEVKENVNKVILKKYGEDKVLEVGAKWKRVDKFWCESARDKLTLLGL